MPYSTGYGHEKLHESFFFETLYFVHFVVVELRVAVFDTEQFVLLL